MDTERWHRIDGLLDAALERAPEERTAFLDRSCGGDAELRREVEELLEADSEAGDFLEGSATELAPLGHGAAPEIGPDGGGSRIGQYRIERELGRGGMAIVYLASRADDAFRREVAIKLINPGMMTPGVVRRFHGERQILASLEHPNIAHLYDGGTTLGGRPYLVMEYIDGLPVDVYCDRLELSIRRRLELFREICSAVHYAHQHLVVHRDIKPSNILVPPGGVPRLLDFGIAKLLDSGALAFTVEATVTGLRPMTPRYASPEQVRGGKITTATDIYSLGVLLYRLLTGQLPHRLAGLTPSEVERVLSEEDPPLPSAAVGRADDRAAAGEAEEASPRPPGLLQQLRRQLSGDLDNIVMMALRKEPGRRYASAEQLAADIERHLEGRPVLARQSTVGYQVGKFLRRHRLWVAAAGTLLALVVVFALAMARQAAKTASERDRAQVEWLRAEEERERAERVSRFLIDLFEQFDPLAEGGESLSVRQLLDRGAEKIERELRDQPEVRASLLDAIGTVYGRLGFYEEADSHLKAALALREERLGSEHPAVAESLFHIGSIDFLRGRFPEAEKRLQRSLEIREQALGTADPAVAETLAEQANLFRHIGRYPEAEQASRRALEINRQSLGPDHPEVAVSLRMLAGTLSRRGEIAEAQRLVEQALAIDESYYGEVHWRTAADVANLGVLHSARGEYEEAEALARRSLAIYEEILPEGHPQVAHLLVILANSFKPRGLYAEAESHLRRALGIYEETLGADHSLVGNCLYELGHVTLLQGSLAEAEPLLLRALEIREASLDGSHPWVAESLRGLADLRRDQGRYEEAEALYLRALAIWEEHPKTEGTAGIPEAYAVLLRATGRSAEAEALERRTS